MSENSTVNKADTHLPPKTYNAFFTLEEVWPTRAIGASGLDLDWMVGLDDPLNEMTLISLPTLNRQISMDGSTFENAHRFSGPNFSSKHVDRVTDYIDGMGRPGDRQSGYRLPDCGDGGCHYEERIYRLTHPKYEVALALISRNVVGTEGQRHSRPQSQALSHDRPSISTAFCPKHPNQDSKMHTSVPNSFVTQMHISW